MKGWIELGLGKLWFWVDFIQFGMLSQNFWWNVCAVFWEVAYDIIFLHYWVEFNWAVKILGWYYWIWFVSVEFVCLFFCFFVFLALLVEIFENLYMSLYPLFLDWIQLGLWVYLIVTGLFFVEFEMKCSWVLFYVRTNIPSPPSS